MLARHPTDNRASTRSSFPYPQLSRDLKHQSRQTDSVTGRPANRLCDLKGEPSVVFQVQSQPGLNSEFQAGLEVVLVAKTKTNSMNTLMNF